MKDGTIVVDNFGKWLDVRPGVAKEIVREALRHCPEFPFESVQVSVQQKIVHFYRDYSLVRFSSSAKGKSVSTQQVYGFYTSGDFRPLDATGRAIELLNNLAPLHLTSGNVLDYTLLRLMVELPLFCSGKDSSEEIRIARIASSIEELPIEPKGIDQKTLSKLKALLTRPILRMIPEWDSLPNPESLNIERGRVFRVTATAVIYHKDDTFELNRIFAEITPDGLLSLSNHFERSNKFTLNEKNLKSEYLRPAHRLSFPPYTRTALPVQEWQALDTKEEKVCRQILAREIDSTKDGKQREPAIILRKSKLSFYRNYWLIEVLYVRERGYARSYKLLRIDDDQPVIHALNGQSRIIHERNMEEKELDLNEASTIEYLRFFCWAIHSDSNPFYVPRETFREIPLAVAPSNKQLDALKKLDFTIHPVSESEAEEHKFPKLEKGDVRLKAYVAYDSAIFQAWFNVESTGMVSMIDDEPLVDGFSIAKGF